VPAWGEGPEWGARCARLVRRALLALLLLVAGPAAGQEALGERQRQLFRVSCAHCHVREGLGVPVAGRPADWVERREQGFERLLRHTVEGVRDMPPLGTCGACTEADFRALVAFLAGPPPPAPAPAR